MLVRLRTTYAGPLRTAVSGSLIDVSEKEAISLVGGGYAEYDKKSKVDIPKTPVKDETGESAKVKAAAQAAADAAAKEAEEAKAKAEELVKAAKKGK